MAAGEVYTVVVGFTTQRPILPDQHHHGVLVGGDVTDAEARAVAAQLVHAATPCCVMVTSTEIVKLLT